MNISARNHFPGTISKVDAGPINAQVELTLAGGDRIVAIVTNESVGNLGLAVGRQATAFVKASWVLVRAGSESIRFSARNDLPGVVERVEKGAVNSEVAIRLEGGALAYAVVTNEAVLEMGLKPGFPASALFKASHVILGVRD
ncbi:MAG: TOBE domain-containing protein [Zoogloeaceae bacterium]|jgi:molybdate transport system regulatory protein|nr:TOBE domain-containing protein [Zoogloeaceae bacterium]